MAASTIKLKYPIIVVNIDRTERKTYMIKPYLEEAIEKANKFGCHGRILLHDEDGSEICDDEILEYHLQRKSKFMICNKCSDWTPQNSEFSVEREEKVVESKVITKQYSCSRDQNLKTNKETTLPERTPFILNSAATSINNLEDSRIFRNDEDCTYPDFYNFAIPWNKIPLEIMELLETGESLLRKINALANLLIDELRQVKPTLPIPIMRRVSERVVSRYPQSFSAYGADKNLSELSEAFLAVLKNRYYNIIRGFIRTNKKTRRSTKPKASSAKKYNYLHDQEHDMDVKIEGYDVSSFE